MSSTIFQAEEWVYVPDAMGRVGQGYYKKRNNPSQTITVAEFERKRAQPVSLPANSDEQNRNKMPVSSQASRSTVSSGQLATADSQATSLTPWDNPVVGEQTASPASTSLNKVEEKKQSQAATAAVEEKNTQAQPAVSQPSTPPKAKNKKPHVERNATDANDGAGSKVVCTELHRQGLMSKTDYMLCYLYAERKLSRAFMTGYHFWAVPYVRLMRRYDWAVRLILPFVNWRTREVGFRMGRGKKGTMMGRVICAIHDPLCALLGHVVHPQDYRSLYGEEPAK